VGLRNNEELLVSHLVFADYMLIFCNANPEQIRQRRIFLCLNQF
jgi:hypothetical protein